MASPSAEPAVDPKWAAENNLTRMLVLTGVFHICALISVGLRLFVRLGLLRSVGKDDIVIVLAAVRTDPELCGSAHLTRISLGLWAAGSASFFRAIMASDGMQRPCREQTWRSLVR